MAPWSEKLRKIFFITRVHALNLYLAFFSGAFPENTIIQLN